MDLFDGPVPLSDAVKMLQAKDLLPTDLTSAQLRQLDRAIRNASVFSARTTMTDILAKYKETAEQVLRGEISDQQARKQIKMLFDAMNYDPAAQGIEKGSLLDLSSFARTRLVTQTLAELGFGAGNFLRANADPEEVDLFPAQELYRAAEAKVPRDWLERWAAAAAAAGDDDALRVMNETGRCVALLDSDIWQELGDGAGGYDDTLGNPFWPFAFGSHMRTRTISRKEATALGLLDPGEKAEGMKFDFGSLFNLPKAA